MRDQRSLALAHITHARGEHETDVIESLYRAARDPLKWPETLSLLAMHMGAETAMIARYDPARGASCVSGSAVAPRLVGTSEASDCLRSIAQQVSRCFTAASAAAQPASTTPQILWDVGSALDDRERTHVALPHAASCDADRAAWIGIVFKRGKPPQPERLAERLDALLGHLMCALDIALELSGTRQAAGATITVLGALPSAALTLDGGARIVHANAAARALLYARDGVLEAADLRLRASNEREERPLASAIQATLAAGRIDPVGTMGQVIRVSRSDGRSPLLIILDPIPVPDRASFLDKTSAVLVRLINEEPSPTGRRYPLHAAFDLTTAETRIAALIASGRSPATAALQLDLSTNTVRTHLARIFDKTGMRSQHALTRLLAAIGSWPLS